MIEPLEAIQGRSLRSVVIASARDLLIGTGDRRVPTGTSVAGATCRTLARKQTAKARR